MTVGLIGYGRFGKLAARSLAAETDVVVFDRRGIRGGTGSRRIVASSLADVAGQGVVVLAVPVSSLRSVLRRIRPYVRPGALVMDVCAVKVEPLKWMKQILPRGVWILGTHPFFGPDSASGGLRGHHIVLSPLRIPGRLLSRVKTLLRRHGLDIRVMSPVAHDKMMAETIFLTQHIGRLVHRAGMRRWKRATVNYARLLSIVDAARNDTAELYADMWRFNPYARRVASALEKTQGKLRKERNQARRIR